MTLDDAITRCLKSPACTGFTAKSGTCGAPAGSSIQNVHFTQAPNALNPEELVNNRSWRSWAKPARGPARPFIWMPPMAVALVLALTSVFNSVASCCNRCSCLLLISIVVNTVVGAACALAGAASLVDFPTALRWLHNMDCGGQHTPAADECLVSSTGLANDLRRAQIPVAFGCFAFAMLQFGRALLCCVVWTRVRASITIMRLAVVEGQLQSTADDFGPPLLMTLAHTSFTAALLADVEPVQDSVTELQHRPNSMPEPPARERQQAVFGNEFWWLVVASSIWLVVIWLWVAMFELYFHDSEHCSALAPLTPAAQRVDTIVGAVPFFLRHAFLGMLLWKVFWKVGGRITGFQSNDTHLVQALLIGRSSMVGAAPAAGWDAIVGNRSENSDREPQSTWEQAQVARQLTPRQAVSSAIAKALMWHSSQPLIYLYVLHVYSCQVASLGGAQRQLAAIVAVREIVYLTSIILAAWECPVFLLMDPITAWNETRSWKEKVIRVAMYVLTPHNFVAFCLANHFRGWRRSFLGLAGIQIMADVASCFALGTLLANGISDTPVDVVLSKITPKALIIGYSITAFGFLLFFGPLSVSSSFSAARDTGNSAWLRASLGVAGSALLCVLGYMVLLFVLLVSGKVNPYCDGFTLMSTNPCSGHGHCYGAGQCKCNHGYGPTVSFTGKPLCAEWYCDPNKYTTLDQPWRSVSNNASFFWTDGDGMKNGTLHPGSPISCGYHSTGVGGSRWYRFTGKGGDSLPVKRPPQDHCGTHRGGWLSGCDLKQKWSCTCNCKQPGAGDCEAPGRYPTAAEGRVTVPICFGPSSVETACSDFCRPAHLIRCGEGFLLWNFGPADYHSPWESSLTSPMVDTEVRANLPDDDARDDYEEQTHRSPLNGGCGAEAWCTTDSATNSANKTVPPKPSPSPSPGPKPTTCEAAEAKLCATAKAKGKTQCTSCTQDHEAELGTAGCHAGDFKAFCGTAIKPSQRLKMDDIHNGTGVKQQRSHGHELTFCDLLSLIYDPRLGLGSGWCTCFCSHSHSRNAESPGPVLRLGPPQILKERTVFDWNNDDIDGAAQRLRIRCSSFL